MLDHAGPSGLIVKAVVDHADGSRETFVSDGTWKISKANEYTNAHDHDPQRRLRRPRRALRRARRAGRLEHGRLRRLRLAARVRDRPAPAAPQRPARDLPPPRPGDLAPRVRDGPARSASPQLADGSIVADFGQVMSAMPKIVYANGVRPAARSSSRRASASTTRRWPPRPTPGDTTIKVASVGNFVVGDKITVDQAANGYGKGDPEDRTITAVGTAGATGTGITLDAAAQPQPRQRPLRRGLARRHEPATTRRAPTSAGGGRRRTARRPPRPSPYWGWRYLQILPPGAGETPTRSPPSSSTARRPPNRRATFDSDNATLDAVFELMQRSGIYSLRGGLPRHADAREGPVHRRHRGHLLREHDRLRRPQRVRPRDPRDRLLRDARLEGAPPAATAPPRSCRARTRASAPPAA